ncbi:hypothetical protein QJS04_geneDACA012882 [Acorus gramineus]|uniref:MULE transposase domain-containing protein n=1 Tax=Acorus gramineus TaxID=55184 RepID=A0AAV9BJ83_ACOGR|nr:hypothetical protein QJS04_geneDACA012882 [Acorus gramineus]
MYGKYKGNLLIATACDAENGLLPIDFAIVESENRSSWTFFLWNLFFSIGCINNVCVISDRHLGIIAGMKAIEEASNVTWHHHLCMRHMIDNFKKNVKSKELSDQVWRAATLKCPNQFADEMRKILSASPQARTWLDQVPPHTWALCYDDGRRHGTMTTNRAESMNSVFKGVRGLPVTAILQQTFIRVSDYFYTRCESGKSMSGEHVSSMQQCLERTTHDARAMLVRRLDRSEFNVQDKNAVMYTTFLYSDHVDCQCHVPKLFHYPCAHVIAT